MADIATKKRTSKLGNRLILIISLVLAGTLLFLAIQGLDWHAFIQILKNGNYAYLPLILMISSLAYLIRAVRWKIFLSQGKRLSTIDVFWANMVSYLGNAYLPARAGEFLRTFFLAKKTGLEMSFIFATILAERIFDVMALIVIGSISLLLQAEKNISPLLTNAIQIMTLTGIIGLTIIMVAPFQEQLILRCITWLPLPQKVLVILSEQTTLFLVGMRSLQNLRRLLAFILLTGVIWLTDAFGTIIGVQIIAQTLNIRQALVLLSALGLSSAIPSTPGSVGVFQFVAVTVLTPFGFSRVDALAFIIISQISNYIVVSFWGLLGLWQINKNKKTIHTIQKS